MQYKPPHAQRQFPNAADRNDANHFQRQITGHALTRRTPSVEEYKSLSFSSSVTWPAEFHEKSRSEGKRSQER